MSSDGRQRLRATVTGRVQGVGFRYFVVRVADRLGLVGWVKNLHTGGVEVVAEGPEDALNGLLSQLEQGPSGAYVRGIEVLWSPASGEFDCFDIAW